MFKDSPYHICLNKSTYRSLVGGQQSVLRGGGQRAEPGTYRVIFNSSGKLIAAKSGTCTTPSIMKQAAVDRRESGRIRAEAIKGLTTEAPPGGLSSSNFSIPQAEDPGAEIDQEFEGDAPGTSADKTTMFLGVLSSLVRKIEKLGNGLKKRDDWSDLSAE